MLDKNTKYQIQKSVRPPSTIFQVQPLLKLSSHLHMQTVHSSAEEAQLVSNLIWRQQTTMPVIKVVRFNMETSDYGYPKIYRIQVEPIVTGLKNINKIQLTDALYLIKNCLLGIQALTYKYNHLDLDQLFFAINTKGECKVWITENLFQFRPPIKALPSQHSIIFSIIKLVYNICSNTAKLQLNRFSCQLSKNSNLNLSYTEINLRISQYAQLKRVQIPNSIKIQQLIVSCPSAVNQDKDRVQDSNMSKNSTPCKVNFRYYSPLPRESNGKSSNIHEIKVVPQAINTKTQCYIPPQPQSQVIWNYRNCQGNVRQISLSKRTNPINHKMELQRSNVRKEKKSAVESMLKSSQVLKNKLKQSKNQLRDSAIFDQRSMGWNQQVFRSVEVSPNGGKYQMNEYSQLRLVKNSSNTKNTSASSSYISDKNNNNGQCGIISQSSQVTQVKCGLNRSISDLYSSSNLNNRNSISQAPVSPYLSHYDFGGLLPLQRPTLQSQILEQGQSFNQSQSNICAKVPHTSIDLYSPKTQQQIKEVKCIQSKQQIKAFTYHSQRNSPANKNKGHNSSKFTKNSVKAAKNSCTTQNLTSSSINPQKESWVLPKKVVRLLSEEDDIDLKQSLYYGEEIKEPTINVELKMLGKMGRKICSTFISQINQYS